MTRDSDAVLKINTMLLSPFTGKIYKTLHMKPLIYYSRNVLLSSYYRKEVPTMLFISNKQPT